MLLGSRHVLMMVVWRLLEPILLDAACWPSIRHRMLLTMMLVAVEDLAVRDLLVRGVSRL